MLEAGIILILIATVIAAGLLANIVFALVAFGYSTWRIWYKRQIGK